MNPTTAEATIVQAATLKPGDRFRFASRQLRRHDEVRVVVAVYRAKSGTVSKVTFTPPRPIRGSALTTGWCGGLTHVERVTD